MDEDGRALGAMATGTLQNFQAHGGLVTWSRVT